MRRTRVEPNLMFTSEARVSETGGKAVSAWTFLDHGEGTPLLQARLRSRGGAVSEPRDCHSRNTGPPLSIDLMFYKDLEHMSLNPMHVLHDHNSDGVGMCDYQ